MSGERIPLAARIFAVADSFDAMTSDRPYRLARSLDLALAEIQDGSGSQFDPEIVQAFLDLIEDQPTLVKDVGDSISLAYAG